ncbi:male-specific protein scotti [Scaptodrosophila lebanonensis]|uniref:Male-specific protein scotti n=1 Tax=Drosophila lebanonensis TaxID=7225 RepID=A0A6J2T534_DROLE|nr:male-specific protein scotti [Scaptodrosophila lebanonensis]
MDQNEHALGNVPDEESENDRRPALWLDAPNEPPLGIAPVQFLVPLPMRSRRKRNFCTSSTAFQTQTSESCALMRNVQRAMVEADPENPKEFFVNYMIQNLNSRNYPGGVGLPSRWGQS